MRNFSHINNVPNDPDQIRLSEGCKYALRELDRHPGLWNNPNFRTLYPGSPHREADCILLRFQKDPHQILDGLECQWWPAATELENTIELAFDMAHFVHATRVGRIMVTRLAPGAQIYPHYDEGLYSASYHRYHLCLSGGSTMYCGDEHQKMRPEELWWFDNKQTHWVKNDTPMERIHLIADFQL